MKTQIVKKALNCKKEEHLIIDPPYTIFSTPSFQPRSASIIFRVGAMKQMLKDLKDEDSFRIEWFDGNKATEYSFIREND